MKKLLLLLSLLVGAVSAQAQTNNFSAPVAFTATTVSTQAMAGNANRTYLIIVNTGSTNNIYVKFGAAQTGAQGVPIPPGGSYEPINAPGNSVWIDTAASTSTVVLQQGVLAQ